MIRLEKFMLGLPLLAVSLTLGVAIAVGQTQEQPQQSPNKPASQAAKTASLDRGAKVFEQNCSRCHNAPEALSPRVSGAVAMHMRVRADLSNEDYKALRQFLKP
jgi:cytochrome c5